MKKGFYLLIAGIFLLLFINLVSSYAWEPIEPSQCINLASICPFDGCNQTNLTSITYPNSSVAISNVEATHVGNQWNYSFCDTSTEGTYHVSGFSTNGSRTEYISSTFKVSALALDQTTSQALGSVAFLFLMIVLMVVFGFVGYNLLKHETLWVLGIFLVFMSILMLIYNTYLGYEYHRLFTGLPDSSVPEIIFYIFLMILVLGLLVSVVLLILNWKKVFKYIKREMRKKDGHDRDVEDWDFDAMQGSVRYR